jgi:hypothetical protein
MVSLISTSETVAPVSEGNHSCELWASADAKYSHTMSLLEITLDSFLQRSRDGKRLRATWLPTVRTVATTVPFEESTFLARKIFAEWTEQVAEAKKGAEPDGPVVAMNGERENRPVSWELSTS